jgi:glycosyltransferase involved in cell wall biosynthesis
MPDPILGEPGTAAESIGTADLVVGIPSYNNAHTIGHVVRAASVGLAKYFPQLKAVIINSDGGSKDGTREAVLSSTLEDAPLMLLTTPQVAAQLLSFPYHGIPGKGSAFRLIFELAAKLEAKACAVVDSDLRSITPEWIDLLLRPILSRDFDFVAPYYHRHKYDGTITNSIVYPLTRCLYGLRVRQPIGGEFGVSAKVIARYLQRDDWETDVARFGIDIWMTTIALAEGFRVCQSFLGAKLHDAKDPGSDLSAMLQQVVSSVFLLMREYEPVWKTRSGSEPATLFGFRFDVGLEPISVNVERMVTAFKRACAELGEVWKLALQPETYTAVAALGCGAGDGPFHLEDELWARVVMDFACAWRRNRLEGSNLLRSLTPLYLARVASFVEETKTSGSVEVEEKIEQLCLTFESLKPYLIAQWEPEPAAEENPPADADVSEQTKEATVEV